MLSLGDELDRCARTNHVRFLSLGVEFLEMVAETDEPRGRMDWNLPADLEGNFHIVESKIARLFNHVLAFFVQKLSIEAQDKIGIPALGKVLDHKEIIEKWKSYSREFCTNRFIAEKIREVAQLRGREGEGRSQNAHIKAAREIENCPTLITSGLEARKLKFVGEKIEAKIDELITTGKIQILEDEYMIGRNLKVLMSVWGAKSVAVSQSWYNRGYRTINDVQLAAQKGDIKLTKQQKIGLKYHADFQVLMGASTVKSIAKIVEAAAENRRVMIVGSYRRKVYDPILKIKRSVNEISDFKTKDVDILIVDDQKDSTTLRRIVDALALISTIEISSLGEHMCMGAILVPSLGMYKRLDIFLCTSDELPCALLAHTGPAGYNVQMRLAAKEKGWTLNEHHLYDENDSIIPTQSERDVQRLLGFPDAYPHERK
jgi:DNA polymerase/3'-5' exonuclease PolX